MENGNGRNPEETLLDLQSYPLLTEEVGTSSVYGGGRVAGGTPGALVEAVVRDVLGWRPRPGDAKGFLAALTEAFAVKEIDGHVAVTWTPKTYAVQADLGTVTGAQASIYARAKVALDQALPLLEGLTPLSPDFDKEDADAMRAVVRTELVELVNELGVAGGPRIQRVDALLNQLMVYNPNDHARDAADPERIGGQLGLLRLRFGLRKQFVNTIAEEQNLTNFRIFVNYVDSLRLAWDADRTFFDRRGSDVFLGTQLVLLSRSLAVIAESVAEVRFTMDSVFLGEAEREVTSLTLDGETITVGELLRWTEHFATVEGPRYIEDGGKDGIEQAFVPTLSRLHGLLAEASAISGSPSNNPVKGFHTPRVSRALAELEGEVRKARDLAADVRRTPDPNITGVMPNLTPRGDSVSITIFGTGFQPGARVTMSLDDTTIRATNVHVISANTITARFDLTGRPVGDWDVHVQDRFDRLASDRRAVRVFDFSDSDRPGDSDGRGGAAPGPVAPPGPPPAPVPAPTIDRIDPTRLGRGKQGRIRIVGTGLNHNADVNFGKDTEAKVVDSADDGTWLVAEVTVDDNAKEYARNVVVTNPDGQTHRIDLAFRVTRR